MVLAPRCIFRKLYGRGYKCRSFAVSQELYCNRHKDNHNYIFEIMDKVLPGRIITLEKELYDLYTYIYDNDLNNLYYDEYNDDASEVDDYGKNIFMTTVDYLFTKQQLLKIIENKKNIKRNTTKMKIILMIFDLFTNTHRLSMDENKVTKITKIQRFYKRWLYRDICRYSNAECENEVDPFTYENVKDIPFQQRFGYKDTNGHIYIFDATEFEYFIRTSGAWNPYTKQQLSEKMVRRLNILINYHKLVKRTNNENNWMTPLHAYTDLSHIMEKMGFYNDVKWFEKLSHNICLNVIRLHQNICADIPDVNLFFPATFKLSEDNYVFEFCKEAIKMFKDADDHFLLCCNFIKAMSLYIDDLYHNLPLWLINIDSAITFSNSNRRVEVEYQMNTDDVNIDSIFLLYVQTLLGDIA